MYVGCGWGGQNRKRFDYTIFNNELVKLFGFHIKVAHEFICLLKVNLIEVVGEYLYMACYVKGHFNFFGIPNLINHVKRDDLF